MTPAPTILHDLALVLGMAAITSVLFRWLRQPPVLGYLLAGLAVGPNVPFPVFADPVRVQALSELGVVLVMFAIGLEFSARRLVEVLPRAGLIGLIQIGTMFWLGELAGRLFDWSPLESLFLGGMLCVSSTMIVSRAYAEQGITGPPRDLVFGVLIVQDLAAVLLVALLTTLAAGGGRMAGGFAATVAPLVAGLAALVVGALVVVPRLIRWVGGFAGAETLLIAGVGICFGLSLLAHAAGFSAALGAFLAGMCIADSREAGRLTPLVGPLRDVFAAIFFVSIGMQVNPADVPGQLPMILAATALVLGGVTVSVALAAFLSGEPVQTAVRAGMSLAQIGEFSFLMAAAGPAGSRLTTTAVAVSVLTAFATPWMIRASASAALAVDRRLPRPVQAFAALYAAWITPIRGGAADGTAWRGIRRNVWLLLLDAGSIALLVILATAGWRTFVPWLELHAGLTLPLASGLLGALVVALAVPLGLGLFRQTRSLGGALGVLAFPLAGDRADLGAAPRRVLVMTLQLGFAVLIGIPLLALTQPFLPLAIGAPVLLAVVGVLGVAFWKSALNFQEHLRAGAQVLAESLLPSIRWDAGTAPAKLVLPGLGEPETAVVPAGGRCAGRTLAEINLRGRMAVTVIGISRGGDRRLIPVGGERLAAGDVLVLLGLPEALAAAREELEGKELI